VVTGVAVLHPHTRDATRHPYLIVVTVAGLDVRQSAVAVFHPSSRTRVLPTNVPLSLSYSRFSYTSTVATECRRAAPTARAVNPSVSHRDSHAPQYSRLLCTQPAPMRAAPEIMIITFF
jgi:mRNA-degrading endonuclease toxin of MazEF toxin-antitoxin module